MAEGTGRVARFELVPLSELGRPRIDVLCNMSGIFRDSFQVGLGEDRDEGEGITAVPCRGEGGTGMREQGSWLLTCQSCLPK